MADYELGSDAPRLTPDAGAGAWGANRPSAQVYAQYTALKTALGTSLVTRALSPAVGASRAAIILAIGDDAVAHMDHYLDNGGADFRTDLEGMIHEVPSATKLYEAELEAALAFVQSLGPGTYDITSRRPSRGYNTKEDSKNWFFAVGGYSAWGKGRATVRDAGEGRRDFALEFEFEMYDRYNWDSGKQVTLPYVNIVVTDHFMGEFHRAGLAREYDVRAAIRRSIRWDSTRVPSANVELGKPRGR
jgi:hypothetical protein